MRFALTAAIMLLASIASGETILMSTSAGYYVCDVADGVPGDWVRLENWPGFGQVIHVNGNGPEAPQDEVATQVAKWTDEVNDPATRPEWSSVWNKVISDIESGKIDFNDAIEHLTVGQNKTIEKLEPGPRAAWIIWNSKVSNLIRDHKRKGTYTIEILESIHKGLVG